MESLSADLTYGKALFEATIDLNNTDSVGKELKELVGIFKSNPDFYEMLKSPAFPNEEKKKVMSNVFEGKISETVLNFISILVDKRRIGQLLGIIKAFEKCVDEKNGLTAGTVFSAVEIPKSKITKLEKETGALLKKNVELKNEIDPSLIGGLKIYIDGKLIDASIRRRLDDLKEQLKG